MKAGTIWGAVVAVVLTFTAAGAEVVDCDQLQRQAERAVRRYARMCEEPVLTPAPTASPTPTVKPTLAPDCSDGTFALSTNRKVLSREHRTYDAGRTYNLCMTVPSDAAASFGAITLESVNHGNSSCNIHHVWMTSPSGVTSYTSGPAPVLRPKFEKGRWGVLVMLDPNDTPCATNKGLSMWVSWW